MSLPVIRYIFSFGILLFGFLVPILPRVYMIHMRFNNPERYKDVFRIFHYPSLYFITVFPFVFLSGIAWFSLSNKNLSEMPIVKRRIGLMVSIVLLVLAFLPCPPLYSLTALPYIFFSVIAWFILSRQNLSEIVVVKRIAGLTVSFLAIGYWGLAVSMPAVWGLAADFFLICSPLLLILTYFLGGLIGYQIVKWLFPKAKIIYLAKNAENNEAPIKK